MPRRLRARASGELDLAVAGHFHATLLSGRALYDEVIAEGIARAKKSVWIATANVKELFVERKGARGGVGSIVGMLAELHGRGVELKLLHAEVPSRRFRAAFDRHPELVRGGLRMKMCPRVHMKAVIIDGTRLYLGSANFTGAGLGMKGDGKRNFELGFLTEDFELLDRVQALFDAIWRGEPCTSCALIDVCPDPGGYGAGRSKSAPPAKSKALNLVKIRTKTK
ncbi:MAG TPA: phospholipase D family protein [Polyangia bacterium]|nr:phospholipase D family protein [Polyangia bacterium]